ncbi:hypothetical protein AMECASPLE_033997 [Ameca splendens]|uniref:Uncharacterized protein n=1 Tax=Ameca splendens TaxID=208324 RepID=A0ABV0YIR5_9TELE
MYDCKQVNTCSQQWRESRQKNMPLIPGKHTRISAVFRNAELRFDGSTSSTPSSSRANSPTPGTYGKGTSTQNSPSLLFPASDMQLKPSHCRIKILTWLSEV